MNMVSGNNEHPAPQKEIEVRNLLGERLPRFVETYQSVLSQDSGDLKYQNLGGLSQNEVEEHGAQLETLKTLLSDFSRHPKGFERRVSDISKDGESVRVQYKRKTASPFGSGIENAQVQLGFSVQGNPSTESVEETTYAVGLRNSPDEALKKRDRQLEKERIQIHTVAAFRDPETGKTKTRLQAGLQLSLMGEKIKVYGLKYLGTKAHLFDLGEEASITPDEFRELASYIEKLAEDKTTKNHFK